MPEVQKNITFGDVWKKYDKWLDSGRTTPEDDRQRYRDHIKSKLENIPLNTISPSILEELKAELFKKELAPATVKHCLVVVRQVIYKAIAWDLWSGENPVKKIKMPLIENKRERYLSPKEANALLKELYKQSIQVHNMSVLSLETGMRVGEICALKWKNIDYNNQIINVHGKGGYRRQAYITNEVLKALQNQKKGESGYVFESQTGGQIQEISNSFTRAAKRIGLNKKDMTTKQRVSFHTLRHTFASWLAINGTSLYTIKELMGHSSITMTERYAHLCPDHKRAAILKIAGCWSSADSDQENSQYPESDTKSGDQL
jgi:integrase